MEFREEYEVFFEITNICDAMAHHQRRFKNERQLRVLKEAMARQEDEFIRMEEERIGSVQKLQNKTVGQVRAARAAREDSVVKKGTRVCFLS